MGLASLYAVIDPRRHGIPFGFHLQRFDAAPQHSDRWFELQLSDRGALLEGLRTACASGLDAMVFVPFFHRAATLLGA